MFQNVNPHDRWVVEDEQEVCCIKSAIVELPVSLNNKILHLTDEVSPNEWMGYLIGKIDGNTVTIQDVFIPEQEVTGGFVDIKQESLAGVSDVIGTIHSHGSSGGKHSPSCPDNETLRQNHPLMMLVGDPYYVSLRLKQVCGLREEIKDVKLVIVDDVDTSEFVQAAKQKIKPKSYAVSPYLGLNYNSYPYSDHSKDIDNRNLVDNDDEIQLRMSVSNEHGDVNVRNNNKDNKHRNNVKCICGRRARKLIGVFSSFWECPVHKTDTTFLDGDDKPFRGTEPRR